MRGSCSAPDVIAPSCILAVLGSYGPSMAGDWLNSIEIGWLSSSRRTDRGASLNVGASTQGTSRCHGSSGAVARGTCDRCDQKTRPPGPANGLPIAAEAIEP